MLNYSWNFWGLSHACHISKMRHNKAETSVSPEKNDMIEKNEISQMGGAYLMSQKLKICKCISYACLTVIWLANSSSIELCEIIYQLNFIYLCISYFLSTNVQSYQRNICEIWHILWHVSRLIMRQVSYQLKFLRLVSRLSYLKNETKQGWDKCLTGKNDMIEKKMRHLKWEELIWCLKNWRYANAYLMPVLL